MPAIKGTFVRSIIRRLSSNLGSGQALAYPEDDSSCHGDPTFLFLGTVKFKVLSACFRSILGIQKRGHSSKKHVRLTEGLHLHCDKKDTKHGLKMRACSVQSVTSALASEVSAYVVA